MPDRPFTSQALHNQNFGEPSTADTGSQQSSEVPETQHEIAILGPQDLAALGGVFPATRDVMRYISQQPVTVTQQLYRYDALGRLVRNDDVAGLSWSCPQGAEVRVQYHYLIPHDRFATCYNPWKLHQPRQVFLDLDGEFTDAGTPLCSECLEHRERLEFWNKLLCIIGIRLETY